MQPLTLSSSPEAAIVARAPDVPVLYLSPQVLQSTAARFSAGFQGQVTYAVKANPHPTVLENLVAAGIKAFDVASPEEIALVRAAAPDAALHYNNPVRSRAEIEAGIAQGVASWSVDDPDELAKLRSVTGEIAVRFKLPVTGAAYDFGTKFGAPPDLAVELLRQVAEMGATPSLCFHPGTQCLDPLAWQSYIRAAAGIAQRAGLRIARLNVGGGFPADRGTGAPALETFFQAIHEAMAAFGPRRPALLCEPGRAMVAGAGTLAVRVKARRGGTLYLNDGIYGGMTELRDMGPSGLIRVCDGKGRPRKGHLRMFDAFGPTCDSLDKVPDGLRLPEDIQPEDYILVGGMGAYSNALSSGFNGYGLRIVETVSDLSGHRAQAR